MKENMHTIEIGKINLLGWLKSQSHSPRVYWSARDGRFELAGCGSAMIIKTSDISSFDDCFAKIDNILQTCDDNNSVRFLGGLCFDPARTSGPLWSNFPYLWYVLPAISITREDDRYYATFAAGATNDLAANDVKSGSLTDDLHLDIVSRIDRPDFSGWDDNIKRSLDMIAHHRIDKVVMARRTDFNLIEAVDPVDYLAILKRANRNCFAFMFEPTRGSAFIGATPERLYKLHNGMIESEAVSGTAMRGNTDGEDAILGMELLSSDKNKREHHFVRSDVIDRIGDLCDSVSTPSERTLLKLSNVSHIYSKMSGKLKADISIKDIINHLHPTPAVGGAPRDEALRFIRELEPFGRGWYAAPVGMIGRECSEMAVAIRSALVSGNGISLFAGAGIVPGSDPHEEWQELEHKIAPALKILGGATV